VTIIRPAIWRRILRRLALWSGGLLGAAALILALGLALPGCSVGYVTRQSATHLRVLAAREPVDEALAGGEIPPEWVPKIETIRSAKEFGQVELGLSTEDLYETISVVRPDPTWVVTACPRDSLSPVTWWFPVAGRVAYRGYYDREDAERFADKLRGKDLDVLVRPAGAFSTLGWFSDPIRPSMLDGGEADLANLVLHEAAHRLLYIKGQTDFNESFASFVGDEGTLLYLEDRHGSHCDICRQVRDAHADARVFSGFLASVLDGLGALYAEETSREEKIRRREDLFAAARRRFETLPWQGDTYAWFPDRRLDNAVLLSLRRYEGRRDLFQDLLARCDDELSRAVAAVATRVNWKELPRRERKKSDPFQLLEAILAESTGCPAGP
jgi:predicted aminopeptidase